MKAKFSDKKHFTIQAIKPHLGLLGIGFALIMFGCLFVYIGLKVDEGVGFIIFGGTFIVFSLAFMLFTLPSSFMYYYEQAEIKKFGSYTTANITNKRVDNYSHKTASLNGGGRSKLIKHFLYVIEFEFNYNNNLYQNECFFEYKSTFEKLTLNTELPIKFLKTNPKNVSLRRRKLANQLGIPGKECQ